MNTSDANAIEATKTSIEFADFAKIELRVGRVLKVTEPDWSHKLLELTVDFGPEIGQRTILSGVKAWYTPADLEQKLFPFVVNLAERKMGQGVSQGMMLMADQDDRAIALPLPEELVPGALLR